MPSDSLKSLTVETDPMGPWLVTIDLPHHQIHEGEMFTTMTASTDLDLGDVHGVIIHTATGYYPHFTYEISASGAGHVEVYKAPNIVASHTRGTLMTAFNYNQASSKTPHTKMRWLTAALATPGTLIEKFYIGGGGSRGAGAGETRSGHEWILSAVAATHYYVKFISGAANSDAAITCRWYEEGAD